MDYCMSQKKRALTYGALSNKCYVKKGSYIHEI